MRLRGVSLLTCLRAVPDFRRAQGRRYPLAETLCMMVMSMMSGCFAYREIGRFMRHNQAELVYCLGLSRQQVPSHVTIRQLLLRLDFNALAGAFRRWAGGQGPRQLSIDGKSLRSTVSEHGSEHQNFVALVSAFCQQTGLIEEVERFENGKQSEISSVRHLLGRIQQQGLLLTLDALHCQKKQLRSLPAASSTI